MAEITNEDLLTKMRENFKIVLDSMQLKYDALAERQNRLADTLGAIDGNVIKIYDLLKERTRLMGTDLEDVQEKLTTVLELLQKR